jgi:general L-amino acid transport system substrate-binding protein
LHDFGVQQSREQYVRCTLARQPARSCRDHKLRLVGTEGNYGEQLGLTRGWAARIIRHVGNDGEMYERNIGDKSRLKTPRGMNRRWNADGAQYAPEHS